MMSAARRSRCRERFLAPAVALLSLLAPIAVLRAPSIGDAAGLSFGRPDDQRSDVAVTRRPCKPSSQAPRCRPPRTTTTTTASPTTTGSTTTTTTMPPPPTTVPVPPGGLPVGVALRPVDGGADYYGRWPGTLPADASFFPIGVWFESVVGQSNIDVDRAVGLNTYVVLTRNSDLALVERAGMHFLAQVSEWRGVSHGAVDGWELDDEIDMELAPAVGCSALRGLLAGLPGDGRLRYNNFGKGVTFWETDAEASCYVNSPGLDVVSADNYWFTDGNICSQWEGGVLVNGATAPLSAAQCHLAANYGLTVERVREVDALDGRRVPVWAFVEVGHPFSEGHWPSIQPAQVRAAVWQSLIAGARGVIYFNHSFGGPCPTQHALRDSCYASVRSVVGATNQQITQLAPVLNAPFADGYVAATGRVNVMAKRGPDGAWYVFAGSAQPGAQNVTFTVAAGSRVEVMFEGRTLPLSGGRFSDSLADGNAVHIYRITG